MRLETEVRRFFLVATWPNLSSLCKDVKWSLEYCRHRGPLESPSHWLPLEHGLLKLLDFDGNFAAFASEALVAHSISWAISAAYWPGLESSPTQSDWMDSNAIESNPILSCFIFIHSASILIYYHLSSILIYPRLTSPNLFFCPTILIYNQLSSAITIYPHPDPHPHPHPSLSIIIIHYPSLSIPIYPLSIPIYPPSIPYLQYPLSIPYLSPIYPLSIPYLSPIYPLSIPYLSPIYPLSIPYLSPIYPLSIPIYPHLSPSSIYCIYLSLFIPLYPLSLSIIIYH